jgi:DNA-binding XRE family transcriptional regulator
VNLNDNPLVALADSIARGYRSTTMYLRMNPPLRFEVPLDLAKSVKADEADLYFRVRLTMNTLQENFKNEASMTIYANYIQLFNRKTSLVYWEQRL